VEEFFGRRAGLGGFRRLVSWCCCCKSLEDEGTGGGVDDGRPGICECDADTSETVICDLADLRPLELVAFGS